MAERLTALIEEHMAGPFVWGAEDCCLSVCNVLVGLGWPDPAEPYRGRYSDEAGARAVMRGTVRDVAERECARLGWPVVAEGQPGDVGVYGATLAICTGRLWALKTPDGLGFVRKVEKMWRPS